MPLYTLLQACMGFSKVHNSHSTNNISSTYKLLACIQLVQSSYNKSINMAFTCNLLATDNLHTFNHSTVYSNNLGTIKHRYTVLRTHL